MSLGSLMFTASVLLGLEGPWRWRELGKACLFSPSSGPDASGDVLTGLAMKEQEGGPQAKRPSCHCREETTPKAFFHCQNVRWSPQFRFATLWRFHQVSFKWITTLFSVQTLVSRPETWG